MLSKQVLENYGANVTEGLSRCMNNENLYCRLVKMAVDDSKLTALRNALEAGNLDQGFELAHALKGVYANLALTPIQTPMVDMTEHLRAREQMDYMPLLAEIEAQRDKLAGLCED